MGVSSPAAEFRNVTFRYERPDYRPAVVLDDVRDVTLKDIDAPTESGIEQIVKK